MSAEHVTFSQPNGHREFISKDPGGVETVGNATSAAFAMKRRRLCKPGEARPTLTRYATNPVAPR